MKIYAALGLAALMTGFGVAGAHAQSSIYVYNFNDAGASGTNSPANTAALFAVDKANQGVSLGGSKLSSNFDPTNIVNFGGSPLNADGGDPAGQALALQGGAGNANNGKTLTATANLTGFQNIGFSFAGQATGTGFNNDTLAYSTDGTNFTTVASGISLPAAFEVQTFGPGTFTALNNSSTAYFRLTFNGATSANGNNRLDNLIISGSPLGGTPIAPVPEASTTVSLGLMLALGGLAFAVKKKKTSVSL